MHQRGPVAGGSIPGFGGRVGRSGAVGPHRAGSGRTGRGPIPGPCAAGSRCAACGRPGGSAAGPQGGSGSDQRHPVVRGAGPARVDRGQAQPGIGGGGGRAVLRCLPRYRRVRRPPPQCAQAASGAGGCCPAVAAPAGRQRDTRVAPGLRPRAGPLFVSLPAPGDGRLPGPGRQRPAHAVDRGQRGYREPAGVRTAGGGGVRRQLSRPGRGVRRRCPGAGHQRDRVAVGTAHSGAGYRRAEQSAAVPDA